MKAAAQSDLLDAIVAQGIDGRLADDTTALACIELNDLPRLMQSAALLRDHGFQNVVTYSRKVFLPLTRLCRDVCHYCSFATSPQQLESPYLSVEQVIEIAEAGAKVGCKEALFTLGDKPELRYPAARRALEDLGFETTIDYLVHAAGLVFQRTGLFPHINAGCLTGAEIEKLRPVSASMGLMVESVSERLCAAGMPHHGSPDKQPAVRLATIEAAGRASVPFTSGILIGIGETRLERVEALLALRTLHQTYGHIQEIIIQNFRAKPDTRMAHQPEPDLADLCWTIAIARLIFGPHMSIQAPPNLSPGVFSTLIGAGLNDWGGVSPVTPDFVNPEAPWPHIQELSRATEASGKFLQERLTLYPGFAIVPERFVDKGLWPALADAIDSEGYPRIDDWVAGGSNPPPDADLALLSRRQKFAGVSQDVVARHLVSTEFAALISRASAGETLSPPEISRLFTARGQEFAFVCEAADQFRAATVGDNVGYVVNRNINYTNVCTFKCRFCAFSKGKLDIDLRGAPYDLAAEEITRRVAEAWNRGATEVCMQGGIHPDYTGETYLAILRLVKQAAPSIHVHAFSPLEVWQGARSLGLPLDVYLSRLKEAGLGSLPGTAAEILDDGVRALICADKITTAQWLEVVETAHRVGLRTTATIMFGHIERIDDWAVHLSRIRTLAERTGGFTEFVPLPFVHMEAPLYLNARELSGKVRRGPTFREAVLMHAVARLVLHPVIPNIQASWVKMGPKGAAALLDAGVNDLGGTLMNESISRAAGTAHGQELPPRAMEQLIVESGRRPLQRTTLYGVASASQSKHSYDAMPLLPVVQTPAGRRAAVQVCE